MLIYHYQDLVNNNNKKKEIEKNKFLLVSKYYKICFYKFGDKSKVNEYYVYAYFDEHGNPFYIGKGRGNRYKFHLWEATNERGTNKFKIRKINKVRRILGKNPKIKILYNNLSEEDALNKEIRLIKKYGKRIDNTGILVNLTDGGDRGITGYKFSEESKRKMSESRKGKPSKNKGIKHTEEAKRKMSTSSMNKKHSKETKKKLSEHNKGKKNYFYGKQLYKELNGFYNKKHSKESRRKMSNTHKETKCDVGEKNGNAKNWKIVSPNNDVFYIKGILRSFCKEQNISFSSLYRTLETKRPSSKGWQLFKVEKK